jgi:hypothetical protein
MVPQRNNVLGSAWVADRLQNVSQGIGFSAGLNELWFKIFETLRILARAVQQFQRSHDR